MNRLTRDIWIVGRFEATRAVGSVRGILVLALYLAASILAGLACIKVAQTYESGVASVAVQAVPQGEGHQTAAAPIVVDQTVQYELLMQLLARGDQHKAASWARTPAIVLVNFWLALFFLPWLLIVSAHDVLARDNELGTLRYVRPRTSMAAWVLGKFVAQALLTSFAVVMSGLVLYVMAASRLDSFDPLAGGLAFASFWWRLIAYGFSILGVLFVVSAVARSTFTALIGSALALFALSLIQGSGVLRFLSPFHFERGLWQPYGVELATSALALLAFAAAGIGISTAWLARRSA